MNKTSSKMNSRMNKIKMDRIKIKTRIKISKENNNKKTNKNKVSHNKKQCQLLNLLVNNLHLKIY